MIPTRISGGVSGWQSTVTVRRGVFITCVVQGRGSIFGEMADGNMALNHTGQIVQEEWEKIAQLRADVQLDAFVVMPNHVHGVVMIELENMRATHV